MKIDSFRRLLMINYCKAQSSAMDLNRSMSITFVTFTLEFNYVKRHGLTVKANRMSSMEKFSFPKEESITM